jgi:hypothetical protein
MIRNGLILWVVLCAVGCAHNTSKPMASIEGNLVQISVLSSGEHLPIFFHEQAYYLLGEMGRPYKICLVNQTDARVEAVVSVDGRDTISGRTADYRTDRGYVIDPREQTCIDGFRSSMNAVAAFEFTNRKDAYASRMGTDANVGVIGVAVFEEAAVQKQQIIAAPKRSWRGEAEGAPSATAAAPSEYQAEDDSSASLGTGYGARTESPAEAVVFERKHPTDPVELVALYYDGHEGLEKRGLRIPKDLRPQPADPNPFPGARDNGFAPPPPPRN